METTQISQVWGEDLRTSPSKGQAIQSVKAQCERFGMAFRHRPSGWGVQFHAGRGPWWWYSEDEINTMVDNVEQVAQARAARGEGS